MRVLVTGATGFIGSRLCERLAREGLAVTALVRPSSDLGALRGLAIDHAIADITDRQAIRRAVRGHEVVIHAAANMASEPWKREEQDRVNIEGTQHVVNSCLEHSVRRLVHISSTAAIGLVQDLHTPATEDHVFNLENSGLNYHLSKYRAEQSVLSAAREGLDAVVVNPASVFGRHRGQMQGAWWMDQVMRRRVVFYFGGGMSLVHVDDVADGIVRALARGRCGERYILGGENLSNRAIVEATAREMKLGRRFVCIPPPAIALAALVLEPLATIMRRSPPITRATHYSVDRYEFYDSTKAKLELGYNPRPFMDLLREYATYRKC